MAQVWAKSNATKVAQIETNLATLSETAISNFGAIFFFSRQPQRVL